MIPTGLKEFVAVVENGSFTAAADALDVSTSFVSRQVVRLEHRLDTRLLHRTTRTVRLTDMGRMFYERSREILDHLAVLESDMADMQQHPKGRVRITAPGYYAEHFVAPALLKFMVIYPEVSIELDTRMRLVDLVSEGFDLAIRMSSPVDSSLVARKVASRRMIVCASPNYLDRYGRPQEPDVLRKHNCLSLPDIGWRFAYGDAIRTVKVSGALMSDNGRSLVAAAVQGHGIVRFANYYIQSELANGELEPVLEEFEVTDAATWIMYPDRHHVPARVRYLIDFLVDELRAMDQRTGTKP